MSEEPRRKRDQTRPLVFVVDDEPQVAKSVCAMLGQLECEPRTFGSGLSAIEALGQARPRLVLLDLVLPEMNGLEVLRRIRELAPELPVVMMSGQGTIRAAVEALRLGATDFLEKPIGLSRLEATLGHVLECARLRREVRALRAELEERYRMVGRSGALAQVRDLISRAAPTGAGVLITGETGVGKELVARAIHLQSPRSAEPFVALNCAAIPQELIESELFGYERGAFTGAQAARRGKLEEADKGTLFLDEVADMSPAAQAKLLRFLERPQVERLGSNEPLLLDVRVLAATNQELAQCAAQGAFRADLYHRLNVITIRVPPLRERREDIQELALFFLERFCRQHNRALKLAPGWEAALEERDWPGNVRELKNLIERVVVLAKANPVEPDELLCLAGQEEQGRPGPSLSPPAGPLKAVLANTELELVKRALASCQNNVSAAARLLGVRRASLHRIIRRHHPTPTPVPRPPPRA